MARVDLNALETGSVLLPERNREIQIEIGSCAAVIVFFRMVADDFTMLRTSSKTKGRRSGRTLDLSAREATGKLRDVSFWYVNPRMAQTCKVLMAVPEQGWQACAYHEGVFELPVELVP